jgi:hypothetical protein
MSFVQDRGPRSYWHSTDRADIWLDHATPDDPVTVPAQRIGRHDLSHRAPPVEVPHAELHFVAAGVFGPGRPCGGTTKWTGDSHRFGIYRWDRPHGRPSIVILRRDGGGCSAYHVDESDALETWTALAALPETLLWNLCHTLTSTYRAGVRAGQDRILHHFLHKRLKLRRRRGTVRVEILPEVPSTTGEAR